MSYRSDPLSVRKVSQMALLDITKYFYYMKVRRQIIGNVILNWFWEKRNENFRSIFCFLRSKYAETTFWRHLFSFRNLMIGNQNTTDKQIRLIEKNSTYLLNAYITKNYHGLAFLFFGYFSGLGLYLYLFNKAWYKTLCIKAVGKWKHGTSFQ